MAITTRIMVILFASVASTILVTLCYIAVVALVHGHPELIVESYRNYASWPAFWTALISIGGTIFVPVLAIVGFAEFKQKRGLAFYVAGGLLAALAIYAVLISRGDLSLNSQTAYGSIHMLVLGVIWGIAYWLWAGRRAGVGR